jgi:hypothetical protein
MFLYGLSPNTDLRRLDMSMSITNTRPLLGLLAPCDKQQKCFIARFMALSDAAVTATLGIITVTILTLLLARYLKLI